MHDKIGENLPAGTAGIIAAFEDAQRLAVEQALPAPSRSRSSRSEKKGLKALQDGLAEAMGKFVPDRTVLPIRTGASEARSAARSRSRLPTGHRARSEAPAGAPNVLVILIDEPGSASPTLSAARSRPRS